MDVLARYVIEMNGSMEQINAHLPWILLSVLFNHATYADLHLA
jgi:hypothetical protein